MQEDAVTFVHSDGFRPELKLTLYALSTCAFCKRAIDFLKAHDLDFRYIYLDKIDVEVKRSIKAELKEKYESLPVFPVLTIRDERALSGFREDEYRRTLDIGGEG